MIVNGRLYCITDNRTFNTNVTYSLQCSVNSFDSSASFIASIAPLAPSKNPSWSNPYFCNNGFCKSVKEIYQIIVIVNLSLFTIGLSSFITCHYLKKLFIPPPLGKIKFVCIIFCFSRLSCLSVNLLILFTASRCQLGTQSYIIIVFLRFSYFYCFWIIHYNTFEIRKNCVILLCFVCSMNAV